MVKERKKVDRRRCDARQRKRDVRAFGKGEVHDELHDKVDTKEREMP